LDFVYYLWNDTLSTLIEKVLESSVVQNVIWFFRRLSEDNRALTAKVLINQIRGMTHVPERLSDVEFKVFSQTGEDGIIQYLISKVPITNEVFVEFGVEDYKESNTRFLLMNDEWKGLIIDSDPGFMRRIRSTKLYRMHDITAVCSFITKENINTILSNNGIRGDIGLLSIDIDGNDFWIWEAIVAVSPRIVICEYNSLFGSKEAVTIPYSEQFSRSEAHYSNLYFGSSLKALCELGEKKNYKFVGCNKAGTNAFFVRSDVADGVRSVTCESGFVDIKSRQSRDRKNQLTFLAGKEQLREIGELNVVDINTGQLRVVKDLLR